MGIHGKKKMNVHVMSKEDISKKDRTPGFHIAEEEDLKNNGGPGSGNRGHSGIPGHVGGSGPGGGKSGGGELAIPTNINYADLEVDGPYESIAPWMRALGKIRKANPNMTEGKAGQLLDKLITKARKAAGKPKSVSNWTPEKEKGLKERIDWMETGGKGKKHNSSISTHGGAGSGNFGHKGREGQVGGSGGGNDDSGRSEFIGGGEGDEHGRGGDDVQEFGPQRGSHKNPEEGEDIPEVTGSIGSIQRAHSTERLSAELSARAYKEKTPFAAQAAADAYRAAADAYDQYGKTGKSTVPRFIKASAKVMREKADSLERFAKTLESKVKKNDDQPAIRSFRALMSDMIRWEVLEGTKYIVAPAIFMTEGVHNNVYYSSEELGKFPESWNGRPVVVYHPTEDGAPVTASQPHLQEKQTIGKTFNCNFDSGKLKGEVWIDPVKADEVDKDVMLALNAGKHLEVSIGVFTEDDLLVGNWQKEKYNAVAHNFRPDHLAVLPKQKGACSWSDGAGMPRLNSQQMHDAGGSGSGNFGHEGIPGHQGGSSSGGGRSSSSRIYTPKQKKAMAEANALYDQVKELDKEGIPEAAQELKDQATALAKEKFKLDDKLWKKGKLSKSEWAKFEKMGGEVERLRRKAEKMSPSARKAEQLARKADIIWERAGLDDMLKTHGGPGSGAFGHVGRPGQIGGGSSGGGSRSKKDRAFDKKYDRAMAKGEKRMKYGDGKSEGSKRPGSGNPHEKGKGSGKLFTPGSLDYVHKTQHTADVNRKIDALHSRFKSGPAAAERAVYGVDSHIERMESNLNKVTSSFGRGTYTTKTILTSSEARLISDTGAKASMFRQALPKMQRSALRQAKNTTGSQKELLRDFGRSSRAETRLRKIENTVKKLQSRVKNNTEEHHEEEGASEVKVFNAQKMGLSVNLSFETLRRRLQDLISPKRTATQEAAGVSVPYGHVVDINDDETFVYSLNGKTYQQGYTIDKDDDVTLDGDEEEVMAVTNYLSINTEERDALISIMGDEEEVLHINSEEGFFVYKSPDGTFRRSYTVNEEEDGSKTVSLADDEEEVEIVVNKKKMPMDEEDMDEEDMDDEDVVEEEIDEDEEEEEEDSGPAKEKFFGKSQTKKGRGMKRQQRIDSLIGLSAGVVESDREELEVMEDSIFDRVEQMTQARAEDMKQLAALKNPPAPKTAEDFIASAPGEMRDILGTGLKMHRDRKVALIAGLKACKRNKFSDEMLNAKSVGELEGLAALAEVEVDESMVGRASGEGTGMHANADDNVADAMPVMDFSKK
jgi:hypothetical protein